MGNLKVVPAKKVKRQPDYFRIYNKIFQAKIGSGKSDLQTRKQVVFWGVRYLNLVSLHSRKMTFEIVKNIFDLMTMIKIYIGTLTPNQLLSVFPISKRYDGAKSEMKDYFTTMDALKEIGMDNPIGEKAFDVLCDYQNMHLAVFNAHMCVAVSKMRSYQGKPSLMETFMAVRNYDDVSTVFSDVHGRKFVYDPNKKDSFLLGRTKPECHGRPL